MLYEALDLFQSCYGNKSPAAATTNSQIPSSTADDSGDGGPTSAKRNLILATVPEATAGSDGDDEDDASVASFVDVHLGGDDTQQLLLTTNNNNNRTNKSHIGGHNHCGKNIHNESGMSTIAAKVFSISATIE